MKINLISESQNFEYARGDEVNWITEFAEKVKKAADSPRTAVEVARSRSQSSILDQLTSILSGRQPNYSSVDAAVKDMIERTGIKEYLKQAQVKEDNSKIMDGSDLPETFNDLPNDVRTSIKNFIVNTIETHHGNISIPAVAESVMQTFRMRGVKAKHIDDINFEKFINNQILAHQKMKPSNIDSNNANIGLGVGVKETDHDSSNSDFFSSLLPNKM